MTRHLPHRPSPSPGAAALLAAPEWLRVAASTFPSDARSPGEAFAESLAIANANFFSIALWISSFGFGMGGGLLEPGDFLDIRAPGGDPGDEAPERG